MIDYAVLLRLAQDFARRMASERPTLQAAYLIGSVARQEPPLADATDIDVVLIDSDPPAFWDRYVRLSDSVLIDYLYTSPDDYRDKQALRRHPFFGPNLFTAVPVYDPRHLFDLVQAGARSQIDKSENVYARARTAYRWAAESFERIQHYRYQVAPMPLAYSVSTALHRVVEFATTAVLLTQYKSHSARRHMVTFEAVARQLDRIDLHQLALEALGVFDLTDAETTAMCEDWGQLYGAANRYNPTPTGEALIIHPVRRLYYQRGFEMLIAAGHGRNAMLLLEQTLTRSMEQIGLYAPPEDAEVFGEMYQAYLLRTYKGEVDHFRGRVEQAGQLLMQVDAFLIQWARRENVDP